MAEQPEPGWASLLLQEQRQACGLLQAPEVSPDGLPTAQEAMERLHRCLAGSAGGRQHAHHLQ